MLNLWHQEVEDVYDQMVTWRRYLHENPELSFKEVNTARMVGDILAGYGIDVLRNVGGHGVVGTLKGAKPGPTIGLRADMDALPIQEENEVSYKSQIPNVMHACGHDIHSAALLGAARVLSEVREELKGNVVFIHQFAEEKIPGGAKLMIEDGCLEGVDVIYGAHVWSSEPIGKIGVGVGPMMAAVDSFEIEIEGKGGHGATPHLTLDPLVTGCQLVLNLQQIVSRRIDPLKPAVVTVGTFTGGNAFNIIPDNVKISGTVRSFEESVRDLIEKSIKQIAVSTCQAAGIFEKFEYTRGYPAVWNDPEETNRVENMAKCLYGEKKVKQMKPIMIGEDFSYYLQKVPGTFFFVGGGNPDIKAIYPHHHSKFDVDERSILITSQLFISLVLNYLDEAF